MIATLRHRRRGLAAAILGLGLIGLGPPAAAAEAPILRRVVLISCDTLRSASLPTYGNQGPLATTGLDSLASEGTLFLRCLTPMGWTLPAHVAMFSGLPPGLARAGAERPVSTRIRMLAERLAAAGFTCAGVPAENHWLDPRYGFGRGMLQFRFQETLAPIERWTEDWFFAPSLLRDPASASFFLFFHFMDNHTVTTDPAHLLPYWTIRGIDLHYHGVEPPLPPRQLTAEGRWDLPAYDAGLLRRAYHATIHSLDLLRLRPLRQSESPPDRWKKLQVP